MTFKVNTLIGNGLEVYEGGIVNVKFEAILSASDEIPENPNLIITTSELLDLNTGVKLEDYRIDLKPDPLNKADYVANIFLRCSRGPKFEEAEVKGTAHADNYDTGEISFQRTLVEIKDSSTQVTVKTVISGDSIREVSPSDTLTPGDPDAADHMIQLGINVSYLDRAQTISPYNNYTIEWSPHFNANFAEIFNVYDSMTSTTKLVPELTNDGNKLVYRTTTDSNGLAQFIIVGTTHMGSDSITATIEPNKTRTMVNMGFVNFNASMADGTLNAPEIMAALTNGYINLENVKAKQIPLTIEHRANIGDTICVFLNGKMIDITPSNTEDTQFVTSSMPKSNILSTTTPTIDDTVENVLQYGITQSGLVSMSPQSIFQAKGSPGSSEPEDVVRTLAKPYLINNSKTINRDLIRNDLEIFIPTKTPAIPFTLLDEDTLIVKLYINAYYKNSNTPKSMTLQSEPIVLEDPEGASYPVTFPESDLLGYDSNTEGGMGKCKIEYIVKRNGEEDRYSEVFLAYIDTVPPESNVIVE